MPPRKRKSTTIGSAGSETAGSGGAEVAGSGGSDTAGSAGAEVDAGSEAVAGSGGAGSADETRAHDLLAAAEPGAGHAAKRPRRVGPRRIAGYLTSERLLARRAFRPAGNSRRFWARVEEDDPFLPRPPSPKGLDEAPTLSPRSSHEVYPAERLGRTERAPQAAKQGGSKPAASRSAPSTKGPQPGERASQQGPRAEGPQGPGPRADRSPAAPRSPSGPRSAEGWDEDRPAPSAQRQATPREPAHLPERGTAPPPPRPAPPKPTPPPAAAGARPEARPEPPPEIDRRPPRVVPQPPAGPRIPTTPTTPTVQRQLVNKQGKSATEVRMEAEQARAAAAEKPEARPPPARSLDQILAIMGDLAASERLYREGRTAEATQAAPVAPPPRTAAPRPAPSPTTPAPSAAPRPAPSPAAARPASSQATPRPAASAAPRSPAPPTPQPAAAPMSRPAAPARSAATDDDRDDLPPPPPPNRSPKAAAQGPSGQSLDDLFGGNEGRVKVGRRTVPKPKPDEAG